MDYKKPNKDNVEVGDFLITKVNQKLLSIPIEKVKKSSVRTINHKFSEKDFVQCFCPYEQAIIEKNKSIETLVGENARNPSLKEYNKFLES